MMYRFTSYLALAAIILLMAVFSGCSRSSSPISPASSDDGLRNAVNDPDSHYIWGLFDITGDTETGQVQLNPVREADFHVNVRRYLEDGPCTSCLELTKFLINDAGNYEIGIKLRHPFPANAFYTGFDVRGVLITDGSNVMPASGLVVADKTLGDIELVNADGFTPLFNTVMYPPGSQPYPILEYSRGHYASEGGFTATLNGYKMFYDLLDRHAYSPLLGAVVEATYEVFIPDGPFRLGYAIDASWVPPTGPAPFDDPINDWPPNANQAEAYQISVYMGTVPPLGGNAEVLIDVYDWQGAQTIDRVEVEAPAYFDDFSLAEVLENGPNYVRYHAYVWNEKSPPGGTAYQVLVRVSDTQINDANIGLKGYSILRVDVPVDNPGQDIIVLADLTAFMLDPLAADNEVYLYNLVSYTPVAGSPAENYKKVLFYEGHGGTMWYDDTTTKGLVQAAGYTYVRHSNMPLHATEDTYKCIFIFMPGYNNHTAFFTDAEVAELKLFAEAGGRLIPISERGIVMTNKDVYNKLLIDLGSGIQGTNVDWNYSITVTQDFIFPDQITENVHSMYVQWPSSLTITPIDKKIFILPDQYNNDIVMARSRILVD